MTRHKAGFGVVVDHSQTDEERGAGIIRSSIVEVYTTQAPATRKVSICKSWGDNYGTYRRVELFWEDPE